MTLRIAIIPSTSGPPALRLARRELQEHLAAACPGASFGNTRSFERADVVLGTFEDLDAHVLDGELTNDRWIDRVVVRSRDRRLILAGANARSVLFAVYTYLESLGFAWVVPGEEGKVVPELDEIPLDGYAIDHTPALLYRGMGMTGAYTIERGEGFVEWMARNRFNHLYLGGASRRRNFGMALGKRPSKRVGERWDMRLIRAAQARGMNIERMGHGWTNRVLNIPEPDTGDDRFPTQFTSESVAMAAEIGGKRAIVSRNTQLCLSHPQAADRMIEQVLAYAAEHPELDALAVWMADGFNNWCECAECRTEHPSDQWVRLINRIAAAVYDVRPDIRVQFLAYASLMEPPPTETLDNSRGNVIFMFAPFHRCYRHRLDDPACTTDAPWSRFPPANQLIHPGNADYFNFLQGWLNKHDGTNYVFDYYAWLPIKRDFFAGNVPRTMAEDLKRYPTHGLDGLIDCARVQSFWPTPLLRWMQSRASWDSTIDYEAEYDRLLTLVYGEHAPAVDRYLTLAYDCLLPDGHGREEERDFDAEKVERFKQALPKVRAELERAIAAARGVRQKMLERVGVHAQYTLLHLEQLVAEAEHRYDEAIDQARQMHALAQRHQSLLEGVADAPEFAWLESDTIRRLEAKKAGTYPTRIERNAFGQTRNARLIQSANA